MIIQRLQFAPSIILDEITVISLQAVEASPQSNVRFCLAELRGCPGRKADIRVRRIALAVCAPMEWNRRRNEMGFVAPALNGFYPVTVDIPKKRSDTLLTGSACLRTTGNKRCPVAN